MSTELDLDDVAAQSDLATAELMALRGQRDALLAALKPFAAGYDTSGYREAAINAVANAEKP